MFEYTFENHFRFGYDNENNFSPRQSPQQKFTAEYGPISDPNVLNWRKANELAAKKIFERREGDLVLLLSGGTDSEICLRSFIDQNIPIKTITLRFQDVDQDAELKDIERLISTYSLRHEYLDIHLMEFVQSKEFYETIDAVKCVSPIIGCHLWLANQIHGTPVIAQGEAELKKQIPQDYIPGVSPYEPSPWSLYESERLCSIYVNFIQRRKPAIPGFFQYLPEQTYSFLTRNSLLSDLINHRVVGKLGTRTSKNLISQQFYPDIPLRQKLHGWENIQKFHDKLRADLALRFPHNDANCKIEYHDLVRGLTNGGGKLYP